MNYNILFVMVIATIVVLVIALQNLPKIRRAFIVPEGYAGLLYQHGVFVRRINAGKHVVWGWGWTIGAQDIRKASLLVAGQDVLTADNVGLKLSLLVTYQVTDPIKAAHETQNWQGDIYNAA